MGTRAESTNLRGIKAKTLKSRIKEKTRITFPFYFFSSKRNDKDIKVAYQKIRA